MNSNIDVTRMDPHLRGEFSARSHAKNHESATVIGSAPPVVANPADITSYYRAMKQRGGGGCRVEGGPMRGSTGSFELERVSRVPKERRALGDCVRQLFTTIS